MDTYIIAAILNNTATQITGFLNVLLRIYIYIQCTPVHVNEMKNMVHLLL